jgi:anti-anti-sigma factor
VDESGVGRRRVALWPYAAVDVYERDGALVVRVEGEVDIANAARVERVAMDAVVLGRPRTLILDLEPLQFLDGAGRAWLHRLGERLALASIELEVLRPSSGAAARMFDLVWPVADVPATVTPDAEILP